MAYRSMYNFHMRAFLLYIEIGFVEHLYYITHYINLQPRIIASFVQ
jgi:hypothetical protein